MAFIKLWRDTPSLVKIEQKSRALYMKTQVRFIVARDIKSSSFLLIKRYNLYRVYTKEWYGFKS